MSVKLLGLLGLAAAALAASAGAAQAKFVHFTTPSGNIDCIGSTTAPVFVSCLVQKATWPRKPPRPASCDLDWSPTEVSITQRRLSVGACRGDVGPLCGPVSSGLGCSTLGYGRGVDIGPIRCTSATTGVTCRYRAKLRVGFLVARERYVLFR